MSKPVFQNHVFRIRASNSKLNPWYLFNYLQSHKAKTYFLNSAKQTTGIASINSSQVKETPILLPPLVEQKKIAEILGAIDQVIQTFEKLIAQKELRKKWLMQNLLNGKKRLKGFSGEWREFQLLDLFNRVTRKNEERNSNVVTISAQRGFVKQKDFFKKNIASEILDNYFLVYRGEFCYNKSYSNGYPWGATKRLNDFDKAVVTTLYICFGIKNEGSADPDFFEQFFNANLLDKGLVKIAHEGGRAHGLLNVTQSDFFSLKISIPEMKEQTAIAQVLQTADFEINLLKTKAEKLREQKKGMMQKLMTGNVRVKI
ncbi:restriction endonuclease subunit S [Algoriphagus sp.]|uniref:restriction endonuclease subunit S n=1 Tax=Algoriphagus sp. TaxID=1872435 RepID=UPI003298B208